MSTPTSRKNSRRYSQTPSKPQLPELHTSPSATREPSSMNPKSEYLRNALHDRRARASIPSTAVEPKNPITGQPSPSETALSSDPWIEGAQSDSDISDHTPIRGRRKASDGCQNMRRPTQRELESQQDKLKVANFDLSLKLRLMEEQNTKLKNDLEVATTRLEELEPLEERIDDLTEDNNALTLKMQDIEEDFEALEKRYAALKSKYVEMKATKEECLAINQDIISEMEQRDAALDEAADLIFQMEQENTALKTQLSSCPNRSMNVFGYGNDATADSPQPLRIHSIDDSRPCTSHIDSDYYSQPASPQVCPEKEPLNTQQATPYSKRARNLVDKTLESRKSIHELKQRMSQVSLGGIKRSPESPIPDVPKIPNSFASAERIEVSDRSTTSTPDRSLKEEISAPRTPMRLQGGLRSLYRNSQVTSQPRPPKLDFKTRVTAKSQPGPDDLYACPSRLNPPARSSSRSAYTSSTERLDSRPQSSRSLQTPKLIQTPPLTEVPHAPTVETDDLTTEADPHNKWWKDLSRLQGDQPGFISPPARSNRAGRNMVPDLFNPAETEDEFMVRAKQHFYGR